MTTTLITINSRSNDRVYYEYQGIYGREESVISAELLSELTNTRGGTVAPEIRIIRDNA